MRCSSFLYPESIARCQHIKVNGVQCGSPALKRRRYCYFHQRFVERRVQVNANDARRDRFRVNLPIIEDANAVQIALMQVLQLIMSNQIEPKQASLLLYGLQIASSNLKRLRLDPRPQEVVIDPRGVADTSLGDDAWYKEEFEDEDEEEDTDEEAAAEDVAEPLIREEEDQEGEDEKEEAGDRETVSLQAVAAPACRRQNFLMHRYQSGSRVAVEQSPGMGRARLPVVPYAWQLHAALAAEGQHSTASAEVLCHCLNASPPSSARCFAISD